MAGQPRYQTVWARWLTGMALTATCAVAVVWGARARGRSIVFAFGVNWVLMMWAIMFASTVVPLRLPARYYATRPFERAGRVYDRLGVGWYRRALRRILWSVNPALLRSQPAARETMIESTKDAETGHLVILLVISGITVWALARGWWDAAGWLLLFNLLHNGYPVLSMRQLRARLNAGSNRLPDEWRGPRSLNRDDERSEDARFDDVIQGLMDGDFTRLAPVFERARQDDGQPLMIAWHQAGLFGPHAKALAEALTCACFLGRTDVAEYMLRQGVDPAGGAGTGLNALHWAANRGHLEAVRLLLRWHAPLGPRSMYGGNVLDTAVWSAINEPRPGQLEIVEELLAAGARLEDEGYPTGHEAIDTILRAFR